MIYGVYNITVSFVVSCMKKKILTFLIVPLYNVMALCTLTFGYYVHLWYIDLLPEQPTLASMTEFVFGFIGLCYFLFFIVGEVMAFMFSFYCFKEDRNPDCESLRDFFERS